jgi:hypothetical protein
MSRTAKLWMVMLVTLVWASLMVVQMRPFHKAPILVGTCETATGCRFTAPIVTLELASNPQTFKERIDQGDPAKYRVENVKLAQVNTYMDLLFILLYWTAFVLLAREYPSGLSKWVIVAISLAASLDLLEDALLLHALSAINKDLFATPALASHLKWSMLALASLLQGLSILLQRARKLVAIGIPLVLSAGFTFWGQFWYPVLGLGTLLLAAALLIYIVSCHPPVPPRDSRLRWFNYLYFVRFSLFLWLVMPTLALVDALKITSAVTLGILTPETLRQLFFSFFFIVTSGWLALTLARIVCAYGKERFGTPPPARFTIGPTMQWSTFLLAQLPGLCLILRVAMNARSEGKVPYYQLIASLLAGALVAFLFWVMVAIIYYWTYQSTFDGPAPRGQTTAKAFLIPDSALLQLDRMEALPNPPVAEFVRRLLARLAARGEGYQRAGEGPPQLHSGHGIALFLFFGYLVLYVGLMGITSPQPLPIVERLTQLLVAAVLVVAGLSYWLGLRSRSEQGDRRPAAPGLRWYRFLSRAAVGVQLLFAALILYQPRSERSFPVLASVFVLLTFATLAFAGLAFWADRYRIPVLTLAFVLVTITNLRPFRTDHQFDGVELAGQAMPHTPMQVLQSMEPDKIRPLIIVTSTGGGIHSAMWTSEILSLLDRKFPQTSAGTQTYGFHDSILLTSTVSGGSVGMMNFLREYNAPKPFAPATLEDHLVTSAACSSLEAVAWGLIYPDLARILFPAFYRIGVLPARYDRGFALEQALASNLTDPTCSPNKGERSNASADPGISTLVPGVTSRGLFVPAFTLNTTATETGDRYLLSNYQIQLKDDKYCDLYPSGMHSDILPAESFLQTFAEPCAADPSKHALADLRLSTAARLSASFTYVSPAARLESKFADYAYHFVDGGYFDNDGTGSVLEFLQTLDNAGQFSAGHVQPILLIEIRNGNDVHADRSPDSYSCQTEHCETPSTTPTPWGPWRQLSAPPQAMYLAGHESITRRNRRELCLLERKLVPTIKEDGKLSGAVIHHVVFPISDPDAALSWHLTSRQQEVIRSAVPVDACAGSNCSESNAARDGTIKSLEDAVAWFSGAQQHPDTPPANDVCRVYPD